MFHLLGDADDYGSKVTAFANPVAAGNGDHLFGDG